jgi:hypothetical protein
VGACAGLSWLRQGVRVCCDVGRIPDALKPAWILGASGASGASGMSGMSGYLGVSPAGTRVRRCGVYIPTLYIQPTELEKYPDVCNVCDRANRHAPSQRLGCLITSGHRCDVECLGLFIRFTPHVDADYFVKCFP